MWKQQLPFVSRKWHRKEIETRLLWQRQSHQKELNQQQEVLDRILPKLIKIEAFQDSNPPFFYRIQVEYDPEFIEKAFIWGNDQYAIQIIASRLSYAIERELRTINFVRFRDDDRFRRRY